MSEKIREWGVTSYNDRFKLIHIDSSEFEDFLEGHIDEDDARLIVAAPDLLNVLEDLLQLAQDCLASFLVTQEKSSPKPKENRNE